MEQNENITSGFTATDVRKAIKEGRLDECIHDFLSTSGNNKPMAEGLLRRRREGKILWVGPLDFPLTELTRCTGPEADMEYPQPLESWETRVGALAERIKLGWKPPILIVSARPWPTLSIRDGNHRHEALARAGKSEYWTLFWFENESEQEKFVGKYKVPKELVYSRRESD